MNNGEIVYITKGIANASITTIITTNPLIQYGYDDMGIQKEINLAPKLRQ
jgi:hypothetical protein